MMPIVSRNSVAVFILAVSLCSVAVGAAAQQVDYDHWAFQNVAIEPTQGNVHVDGAVDYGAEFPTSGAHSPTPAAPGFHDRELNPEALVHALEHGNVVIYYDQPDEKTLTLLNRWTAGYQGALDGVIAVRRAGLGARVVLTAWERRLELDILDSRGAYFVDAFRGRGPEQSVR